jgi:hypothetical protein
MTGDAKQKDVLHIMGQIQGGVYGGILPRE